MPSAVGAAPGARRQGSGAADAAAAAGVSRATLYRWAAGAEPCSRRPHTPRRPAWSAALVTAVRETRADYNGAWRYEFYASWNLPNDNLDDINRWIDAFADEFNTFRPHQALGGHTPAEYLHSLTAKETPVSHMS